MTTHHTLRWVGAESFVTAAVTSAPSILRFASDDFMDRVLQTLAQRPQDLIGFHAKSESWTAPGAPTAKLPDIASGKKSALARLLQRRRSVQDFRRQAVPAPPPSTKLLKLFQPIHQRYYLAAAHLVCELPGLPPRKTSAADRTGFVIRRLYRDAGGQAVEHGFVKGADGRGVWVPIAHPHLDLASGEDLLPVFPLGYAPPTGPTRALSGGLIPVAQHDAYVFASRVKQPPPDPTGVIAGESIADQLKTLARTKIIAPWDALLTMANRGASASDMGGSADAPWFKAPLPVFDRVPALKSLNDQLVEGSWRVLQESREWLSAALPDLLATPANVTLTGEKAKLLAALRACVWTDDAKGNVANLLSDDVKIDEFSENLFTALVAMTDGVSSALDATVKAFPKNKSEWPTFFFPLALATPTATLKPTAPTHPGDKDEPDPFWKAMLRQYDANLVALLRLVHAAIDEAEALGNLPTTCPQPTFASELSKSIAKDSSEPNTAARFVLRFVHVRCDCGPLSATVLSAPSEVFQLAGFFDTDAPMRPLRIALPFDTTPGGLRKFSRNSAFIASDVLCGQIKRVRQLGLVDLVLSVLPWPFHKDLKVEEEDGPCGDAADRFGMICSLSIPIITIVAFVLLIVIAVVLDLIFHWLPFLLFCFPVKGLKAKQT